MINNKKESINKGRFFVKFKNQKKKKNKNILK